MKRLMIFATGLLIISSAGFSADFVNAKNCSDAYGIVRMAKVKTEDGKDTQWFYEGSRYDCDEVKGGVDEGKTVRITGDEYNGVYVTLAKFKAYQLKIKNRRVICQDVNTEKSKIIPDETTADFSSWTFPAQVNCSNATGTTRKVSDQYYSTWYINNEPVPPNAVILANTERIYDTGESSWVYEVMVRYDNGSETIPTFVLCQ